jgi:hypothetical protein
MPAIFSQPAGFVGGAIAENAALIDCRHLSARISDKSFPFSTVKDW